MTTNTTRTQQQVHPQPTGQPIKSSLTDTHLLGNHVKRGKKRASSRGGMLKKPIMFMDSKGQIYRGAGIL